ncbi:hypothetical protein OS493_023727 [Desmophyllum pertusum]|uniref:Uncharacterized protein n=1 Tax=Desmophyllum pertusum TaxID=174260 RepID=A0A9X0CQI3_9CNID|nr:hypothetical protein OS493_023727 [Desmophyllum pertusum]
MIGSPDSPENQPAISYDTYLKLIGEESSPNRNSLTVEALEKLRPSQGGGNFQVVLMEPKLWNRVRSWTDSNDNTHTDVVAGSLAPWNIAGVEGDEDEMPVMNNDLSPGLDEDESFRELQEILPDIIQGCKISNDGGKKKKTIFKANSSSNVEKVDNPEGSFLSTSSCEGKSSSISDLQAQVQK